jgi:hypothetical protein
VLRLDEGEKPAQVSNVARGGGLHPWDSMPQAGRAAV